MRDWGTSGTGVAERFSDSKVRRARKRRAFAVGSKQWVVFGDERLGDAYPAYTVTEIEVGDHHCTCQDHSGGQFRPLCTHIIRVLLGKEEGEWTDTAPVTPSPVSVDGGSDEQSPTPSTSSDASLPAPSSLEWGTPRLPEWVKEWRPHQVDAVVDVVEAFQRGARVVFLDAPTGSGKTLIAEAVRRMVGGKCIYTCTTKTLQDQFVLDFPYAALLKGRDNYPTELAPFPKVTCGDCTGKVGECNWCEVACAYKNAKRQAANARLSVLNTAYLMTVWNKPRPEFTDADLVVLDEGDLLEHALMGFVEVRVGKGKLERYELPTPRRKTMTVNGETKPAIPDWVEWVEVAMVRLRGRLEQIPEGTEEVRLIREGRWLAQTLERLDVLKEGLEAGEVAWVYDNQRGDVVFRPVEVNQFGEEYLWSKGKRFLVMSATIISAAQMAESLGLEEGEWDVVKVPSTFPAENRPIRAVYAGRVTNKTYGDVIGDVARYVKAILRAHPGERVLVHTVSYRMAADLAHLVSDGMRPIRTYTNAGEREGILQWMKRVEGAVVFAPSFDRGVDLPGDLCTVQVVAKVPYPYLGDEQVRQRLYGTKGGQLWYAVQTVRTLVQMTGRGVRSEDDTCTTYILDRQFQDFFTRNRGLFPDWWREALDFTGRARHSLGV